MSHRSAASLWRGLMSFIIAASFGLPPSVAFAQDDEGGDSDADDASMRPAEEVVVTGTRKSGLVPTETLSPVDVVTSDVIVEQASFDLTDGITRITASFNTQRFPIADGTSFIRPVTLRNLSPDHTLVLINGTRRHRSALVNLQLAPLGTTNQGSQAVDFSTLPAAAIDRIEVLRDGASAQYGSDAIAGVVNVILKDDAEGASFYRQSGEYYDGDGSRFTVGGNAGLPLGDTGFMNLSFERSTSDETSRGVARPDAAFVAGVVGDDVTPIDGFGQRWGDPNVEAWKFFVNSGVDVSERLSLYGHASWGNNETRSDFFYRGPVLDPEYEFDARATLQQDSDGDFIPDPAPQELIDEIVADGLDPNDYLVADASSASGYVLRNPVYTRFPGGYNPNFGADMRDYGVVVGANGILGDDGDTEAVSWDARFRTAENKVEYRISDTINPSLGLLSPNDFKPGTLIQQEISFNADVVKPLEVGLDAPLNAAVGFEYREETYEIEAGDEPSIEAGPTAAIFGVGSDGFQGFPTESAGSFSSESFAGYADLETDFTDMISGGVAARYEDYEAFGSTFDWKVSGRVDASERLAFRATANSGFRAPTPGQIHTLNVTTSADSDGNLIPSGVYPVDHPVALALGAVELDPEESTSFTVGVIVVPDPNVNITVDFYRIDIQDRLALQNNTITDADVPALEAEGVEDADLLVGSLANFFSNAYDSEVTGVDVRITTYAGLYDGLLTADLNHNFNQQEVSDVAAGTINDSRVFDLENQVPEHKTILTLDYERGRLGGTARVTRYGEWKSTGGLFSPGDASDASTYEADVLVDAEARMHLDDRFEIAFGGSNIFDNLPDHEQDPVLQFLGVDRSLTSPYGFNGGFWYARIGVSL